MKRLSQNAALLIASVLIAILAIEAFLRAYNPFEFRMRGDEIVLPQNFRYEITNDKIGGISNHIVHVKNAMGFRGPPIPDSLRDHLSIIAVGGSTTESFYQSDGKDWPALVAQRLGPHYPGLWINNAGLDGHSTIGHLHLLTQVVARIRPNIALFLIGTNDVGIQDVKADDLRLVPGLRFDSASEFVKSLAGYSEVTALALNLYRYWHTVRIGMAHGAGFVVPKAPGEVKFSYTSVTDPEREKLLDYHQPFRTAYGQRIRRLVEISRDAGILPVLITQPALISGGIDPATGVDLSRLSLYSWRWGTENIDGETGWQILESYNNVTRRIARETDVPLIDLAEQMPKSTMYFYDKVHFTDVGAAKVAEIVSWELCAIPRDRLGVSEAEPCD